MNQVRRNTVLGLLTLTMAGALAGCATDRTARFAIANGGQSPNGASVPEFTITEQDGTVRSFESVRSAVTVVAFPEPTAWPKCSQCAELQDLASRAGRFNTPVTVLSVVTPHKDCVQAQADFGRCTVHGNAQLVAVCDAKAQVRSLFGPNASGKYFIIDADRNISAQGSLGDNRELERGLRSAVEHHEQDIYWEVNF